MVRSVRGAALAALGMVALATTACQPPPPRLALSVTTTAIGSDDVPGDGVCASAAAAGACTLQAAIEEGNLAPPGADISLPGGDYDTFGATITGDLRVQADAGGGAYWPSTLNIEPGGRLELVGLRRSALNLDVRGGVVLQKSFVRTIEVFPGGSAFLNTSTVLNVGEVGVTNQGTVVAVGSTIGANGLGNTGTPLSSSQAAVTYLKASVLARPDIYLGSTLLGAGGSGTCLGNPPTSLGYVFTEVPCGTAAALGDADGPALVSYNAPGSPLFFSLDAASPLVDAIPLGDPACDPTATDFHGNPRGVDGNGDGIGGCDIGAVERQPS